MKNTPEFSSAVRVNPEAVVSSPISWIKEINTWSDIVFYVYVFSSNENTLIEYVFVLVAIELIGFSVSQWFEMDIIQVETSVVIANYFAFAILVLTMSPRSTNQSPLELVFEEDCDNEREKREKEV
ncbi:hypothetical protein IKP94_00365 [Candidatus Saccharibacteria bacterium]|nr:hypothetical protein [Candidatus Saccharibacteria bacterium]